jgi:prepilin-type N-terminal cleavage/methylation domain-containing protein
MIKQKKLSAGFTLIELLVVIAIIGVLVALLLANMVGIRGRAADAKIKNDLNQLKTALRLYYNDYQAYPAPASIPTSGDFAVGDTLYMRDIASVRAHPGFAYNSTSPFESFTARARLDNAADQDLVTSRQRCGVTLADGEELFYYVCND